MNSDAVEENMTGPMKIVMLAVFLIGLMVSSSLAYDIPQRRIDLKPYLNFMFPNNLVESDNRQNPVENEMGIGFGVKARTQITRFWGFLIDASFTDLKVNDNSLSTATIFTAGFYYSYRTNFGNIIFDAGYGVLSVADLSSTLLMPNLEFNRAVSDRISLSAELGMPIANDWFHQFGVKENYKSLTFSLGGIIIF
jgi:hypothetical protein